MAPLEIAIFPLIKKPELTKISEKIKENLEKHFILMYDESSSIGKRYLRAAMQGIPYAITIDFDSIKNNDVTIRDRDSEKQIRVSIDKLEETLKKLFENQVKFEKAGKLIA